jgi:hypothetical protein
MLGVKLINTTAYHPQSILHVERCHAQLKAAMRPRLVSTVWPDHLCLVLLGLRSAPKEESAISSAELMFGTTLSPPAEFIQRAEPPAEQFLEKLQTGRFRPPGHLTEVQILTPQLSTVFPGMSARFFARPR